MAQYVFTMNRVGKIVPPKRHILKDVSLSFFPGAKIGVLGVNGSGKSTLLKIMAGLDTEIEGEATPMPGLNIGYLPQEPVMDPDQTVRQAVEGGMGAAIAAKARLEQVYIEYGEDGADFDKLAAEQAQLETIIGAAGDDDGRALDIAAEALRLPEWDATSSFSPPPRMAQPLASTSRPRPRMNVRAFMALEFEGWSRGYFFFASASFSFFSFACAAGSSVATSTILPVMASICTSVMSFVPGRERSSDQMSLPFSSSSSPSFSCSLHGSRCAEVRSTWDRS